MNRFYYAKMNKNLSIHCTVIYRQQCSIIYQQKTIFIHAKLVEDWIKYGYKRLQIAGCTWMWFSSTKYFMTSWQIFISPDFFPFYLKSTYRMVGTQFRLKFRSFYEINSKFIFVCAVRTHWFYDLFREFLSCIVYDQYYFIHTQHTHRPYTKKDLTL